MLKIDPADPRPIWRQIEEGVRHLVAVRALPAGEMVPSVRDLARDLQVNPATVSRAYQRLTDDGVLQVRRGEGTFVSDRPPALPKKERSRQLDQAAAQFAGRALAVGVDLAEATDALRGAWQRMTQPNPNSRPGDSE